MQYSERMSWLGTESIFEILIRCKQLEAREIVAQLKIRLSPLETFRLTHHHLTYP